MPDEEEVVADVTEVVEEQAEAVAEPEKVAADEPEPVADATKDEGAASVLQRQIDLAVGKAQVAWQSKLEAASRIKSETEFLREENRRLREPKAEPKKPEDDVTLPDGFDLLPKAAQDDYLQQKRLIRDLGRRDSERESSLAQMRRDQVAREIDSVIEDMKEDTENFPGFAEVYPQIEEQGRQDPDFLRAVVANPKKWLRMAYRDMTSEKAPALAEKAYEAKLEKQRKARTAASPVRDAKTAPRGMNTKEAMEKAMADTGYVFD